MTMFGLPLKKGLFVTANWVAYLHNPSIFENPFDFIPERWEKDENKQHQQVISLTFSGGPRACLGKTLAMIEAKVMVIKFMRRYQKLYEPGRNKRVVKMLLTMHLEDSQVELFKKQ